MKSSCTVKVECQYNMAILQKSAGPETRDTQAAQALLCSFPDVERQTRSPNASLFHKRLNKKTMYKLFIDTHFLKRRSNRNYLQI